MPFVKGQPAPLNAGRKKKTDEIKITSIALSSIVKKYDSLEKGFIHLLESKEPSLIKFVFEHAAGKPREKMDVDVNKDVEHVQIIQLPSNNRSLVENNN
jgi:hypothetical protein